MLLSLTFLLSTFVPNELNYRIMIKIKFTLFVYLHRNNNGVMVRVRWDNKREEVVFSTGCVADPTKWNNQCAKTNTTHKVGKHSFTSQQINNEINKNLCYCLVLRLMVILNLNNTIGYILALSPICPLLMYYNHVIG